MVLLRSIRRNLLIARRLSATDWLLLVEAWWGLLYFSLASKRTSFEHLDEKLKFTGSKRTIPSDPLPCAWRLQKLVYLASRLHRLEMTCLVRAYTLQRMLRRRGIPSDLRIGINRSGAAISAHAWVEVLSQAVGEPEDIGDRFSVLGK